MGIFDVNMPMMYGEGRKSFIRLQEEILKKTSDLSLFAWQANDASQYRGLLARSPAEFLPCGNIISNNDQFRFREEIVSTNKGIRMGIPLHFVGNGLYIMDLDCFRLANNGTQERLGIWLARRQETHLRQFPGQITKAEVGPNSLRTSIFLVSDTDPQAMRLIPKEWDHRIYIIFPDSTEYSTTDIQGVPSAFWHADDRFFSIGELVTFTGFLRFTVVTSKGLTTRFVLVCVLDGLNAMSTSLHTEYGFDTSTKPPGFIDPFDNINGYGSVGDPFSMAVLNPGCVTHNAIVVHANNDIAKSYLASTLTFRPDERNPGLHHIMLDFRAVLGVGGQLAKRGELSVVHSNVKKSDKRWRDRLRRLIT